MSVEHYHNTSFINDDDNASSVCVFHHRVRDLTDFLGLFENFPCYRHSVGFTVFLCLANIVILFVGLLGNFLVIFVVICKIKKKTASSIFILNLAVADLLVILCCIPATLVANLFTPWVFGELMCKVVAYSQGVSVFCSVFSLVAISFDRFRAIHHSLGVSPNITNGKALKTVLLIWLLGATITTPWAIVFKVRHINPREDNLVVAHQPKLPFCQEIWETKAQEVAYFLLIHVFACFTLPLGLITKCNVVIWRNVLDNNNSTSSPSSASFSQANNAGSSARELQRQRKLRILKLFTGLTFTFFVCWLPLYVIMARVKFSYTDTFTGSKFEQKLVAVLIPLAQLLGSCNSCVNPVLYALLNQKFRQSFRLVFSCPLCAATRSQSMSLATREENNAAVVVGMPSKILGENSVI